MKTNLCLVQLPSLILVAAGLAILAGSGCSKSEPADVRAKVEQAYKDTKTAVADTWKDVKSYTFEKHNDFTAEAKALTAKMDDQVRQLHAEYSDAQASARHSAAMDDLKKAQADFKQKVADLGHATADTWDHAKQDVLASWDRLQAAYKKARGD